ncbi:protein of unknown function [Methanoculleus bourgensis]|uniref:Uncharacterized protein n=1 Tax=Methanoculleus bourgensis TaxID=83986 RepID=A0A0X3BJ60_9EURY|nr:protein of unknown function [Methanoculleus bourgensis]
MHPCGKFALMGLAPSPYRALSGNLTPSSGVRPSDPRRGSSWRYPGVVQDCGLPERTGGGIEQRSIFKCPDARDLKGLISPKPQNVWEYSRGSVA